MNIKDVAGLKINSITKVELLDEIQKRLKSNEKTFITTVYSEFLFAALSDVKILELLNKASLALPDGIGIFWAKKFLDLPLTAKNFWTKIIQALWQIKYSLAGIIFNSKWIRSSFAEKIVGADLVWDLADLSVKNKCSIYLLGGFGDTPQKASLALSTKHLALKIAGWSNKNPDDKTVIEKINQVHPDILFVAYGPIKQEKWISENLEKLNIKLAIGVGGSFDYIAGKKISPPKFIRKIGLEWLWRLFTQPERFFRILDATFGLAYRLWHYKVFSCLPLRKNVAVVILNNKNEVLVCERSPRDFYIDIISNQENLKRFNYWQLPQGGIDVNKNIIEAAKREAFEETGIKDLNLIGISKRTHTYIWNNALRNFWKNRLHKNNGQIQNIAFLKFSGTDNDIKIDNKEFINFKWVGVTDLDKIVHSERLNLIKIVQEDLKEMAEKGII